MNQGTVGYAIIGCGMIARFHIAAIQEIENARLVGVFDQQQINANRIAAEFQVKAYESMPELWEDTQVDAVCICTPSGLHATLALEALSHGKHVLIEKPMALNEQDCDAIICAAKETQRLAGVVSQMRFSPDICRVKEALDQGLIGKLISVDLIMKYFRDPSYYQNSTWRGTKKMDGGGALMNQGIHGVDLMQYLVGMPSMVYARAKTLVHKIEVEDLLNAVVEYPSGAQGIIQASTCTYPGFKRRLEFYGEKGFIVLEEDRITSWNVPGWDETFPAKTDSDGINGSGDPSRIGVQGHIRQLLNFTLAVLGKEQLLIDGVEGRKTVDLIRAAYQSSERNCPIYIT